MPSHHKGRLCIENLERLAKEIRFKPIVRKKKMAVFASSCLDP
jgi:hypothetical protein